MNKDLKKLIEKSMLKTCNSYAAKNNMLAATAIHDAYLCLIKDIESYETKTQGAKGT